jgi:hypothetical protein
MSQNPFDSPKHLPSGYFGDVPLGQPTYTFNRGMIGHVPIVGGLLIGQALLEATFFGLMAISGVAMSTIPPQANMPKEQLTFTIGAMIVLSIAALLGTIAHFVAGLLLVTFRRRKTAMIFLCIGFVSIFTFYCSITMLPIAIYALIVLVNEPVAWAYAEIAKGTPRDQVMMGQPIAIPASWSRPIS